MPRTRIKFCGITRPADAVSAAEAGADAIGLIFFDQSPRCVSVDRAREILLALPPMVSPVALFVNTPVSQILQTVRALNVRTVQLHGDESIDYLPQLTGLTIIKAIHSTAANLKALARWRNAAGILLDTPGTAEHGGTGLSNDWLMIESFVRTSNDLPRLIAAGGLTPESVAGVVQRIRPWGVDVSSGIEASRGVKSEEKMRRFVEEVRRADSILTGAVE
jgi:phosphoribosylanthranilate isomerase